MLNILKTMPKTLNFYPSRDTMIDILRADMPFKINFESGIAEDLEGLWDLYQRILKKIPDKAKRDMVIVESVKTILVGDALKQFNDNVKGDV